MGMQRGTVKWFNDQKGYGFVVPEQGGGDVFVHHSVIQANGFRTLAEGQRVQFEATRDTKGLRATRVMAA